MPTPSDETAPAHHLCIAVERLWTAAREVHNGRGTRGSGDCPCVERWVSTVRHGRRRDRCVHAETACTPRRGRRWRRRLPCGGCATGELDGKNRMQFDRVRCDTALRVLEIPESYAGHGDSPMHVVHSVSRGIPSVKDSARCSDVGAKRAAQTDTIWCWYLSDHCSANSVTEHKVKI